MKTSASLLAMALALSLAGHAEAKSKAKPKSPPSAAAPAPQAPKAWSEITASAERRDGLLPVYVDKAQGKIWLELPAPGADGIAGRYIWLTALKTGLGSAPVGLDRHQPGQDQILVFRRVGKKLFAEVENPKFVATGAPADEQKAAEEAFAYSTVWGSDVAATAPDGRMLVDISGFLTRDVMGVADSLKNGGEPGFKLVDALSAADPAAVKAFPENLEFEARQTFASDTPGAEVRNIAPEPKQISFVVRHSLVKLPEPGFKPVAFDPRVGTFAGVKLNFASPLGQPIVEQFASRFRLEKTDPSAARSRVKKPIVFYVDRSAPEPIRSALVEGAGWWSKAFEDAGYIDAFRVEVLPEGADPLDVRYNVIHWVNRATRGWSYGQPVIDPRTGETIKGSVLLGSLRVRQDILIFESLAGADQDNTGGPNDPVRVALTRIRQLGAHETGHALGFAHNFAASTQGRISVMDYPPPRIGLKDGRIDLSAAYATGIGRWDRFTVDWLYGTGDANAKTTAAIKEGLRFVTDGDARPQDAAQPWGSLWDDGADPAAELSRMMAVRRAAIDQFGTRALHPGEPVADLRRRYVPLFLLHRYQLDAASKMLGGVDYAYALNGDGREASPPVPAADQRRALGAMLETLSPGQLDTPERLLPLLSAGWSGDDDRQFDIEVFGNQGGPVFDPLVAADVAATMTFNNALAPGRLNRLADQHRRMAEMPGSGEVLDALIAKVFAPEPDARLVGIQRRVQTRLVLSFTETARDASLSPTVAAEIEARLRDLAGRLDHDKGGDGVDRAHRERLARLIRNPDELDRVLKAATRKLAIPPGQPIGAEQDWFGDLPL